MVKWQARKTKKSYMIYPRGKYYTHYDEILHLILYIIKRVQPYIIRYYIKAQSGQNIESGQHNMGTWLRARLLHFIFHVQYSSTKKYPIRETRWQWHDDAAIFLTRLSETTLSMSSICHRLTHSVRVKGGLCVPTQTKRIILAAPWDRDQIRTPKAQNDTFTLTLILKSFTYSLLIMINVHNLKLKSPNTL